MPLSGCAHDPLAQDATIVILSACPEGLGWHSVLGPGTALRGQPGPQRRRTFLFSSGVNRYDCEALYGTHVTLFRECDTMMSELHRLHPGVARVAVFPACALQMAAA